MQFASKGMDFLVFFKNMHHQKNPTKYRLTAETANALSQLYNFCVALATLFCHKCLLKKPVNSSSASLDDCKLTSNRSRED